MSPTNTSARKKKKNGQEKKKSGPKPGQKRVEQRSFKSRGQGKKTSLTIGQKLQVMEKIKEDGWTQQRAAEHFSEEWKMKIKQGNISRWLKKREQWLEEVDEDTGVKNKRRKKAVTFPTMEAALVEWITQREAGGDIVTGPLIVEKACRFCQALGIGDEELALSSGWLDGFKSRHGIRKRKLNGEAGSVNPQTAEEERIRLRPILEKFAPEDRFNVDESSFFFRQLSNYALGSAVMSGKKLDKTRLTILVGSNQTGSEKVPLLFIGKAKQPRCFRKRTGRQLGFDYYNNKHSWMTGVIFKQWIEEFDARMGRERRKVLLLIDNFSGHKWDAERIENVQVEPLTPNLTSHVQPMDAGIIHTLKALYKKSILMRSLDREESGEANIFKLDMLESIRFLEAAWERLSPVTIANCWKHTGIIPSSTPPNNDMPPEDESTREAVSEAATQLKKLNNSIINRTGSRANDPRPALLPDIEQVLQDPPPPVFPLDKDEIEFIKMVTSIDDDDEDDEPELPTLEKDSTYISMLQALENLAIFHQNEREFCQLGKVACCIRTIINQERTQKMTNQTLDSFFSSSIVPKEKEPEVMTISDEESDSDSRSDVVMHSI